MTDLGALPAHTVAVFESHEQAEGALKFLINCGHEVNNLSIIGPDCTSEEPHISPADSDGRLPSWGKLDAFWGASSNLHSVSAVRVATGIGCILLGGWLVESLDDALVGGRISTVGDTLECIGIPPSRVPAYEDALSAGSFLILVRGNQSGVQRAGAALAHTPATYIAAYSKQLSGGSSELTPASAF